MAQQIYDMENKQWGCFEIKQTVNSKIPIGKMILNSISMHGFKVAQVNHDTGVQVTFHEMRLKAIRAAQNLQKMGVKQGQMFSFLIHRSDDLMPILLASLCLGCPINTMHPILSRDEIVGVLKKTEPSLIFCGADFYNQINEALIACKMNVKVFTFDGQIDSSETIENLFMETHTEEHFEPISVDVENDVGACICTSGTTGPLKCISLSYRALIPSADEKWMVSDCDIGHCFDSIYWLSGLGFMLRCALKGVKNIITKKPFSSDQQLDIIQKSRVTVMACGPLYLAACLKNKRIQNMDFSSMKLIIFYGSKTPAFVLNECARYFPNAKILSYYGTTENGRICDIAFNTECLKYSGTLVNGCAVKIVDDNGARRGPNECGEICVKTSTLFLGYLNDAEAMKAAIDNEGFFLTGDIGHFDDRGHLFVDDRKKDLINAFYFENVISPTEIESFLISLPDIKEVAIVGIPIQDKYEIPTAVIVRIENSTLSQRDVFDTVAEKLSTKLCGGVYFVDSVPKTHNGKIMRTKIRELAINRFTAARNTDSELQLFLGAYPKDFKILIDAVSLDPGKCLVPRDL